MGAQNGVRDESTEVLAAEGKVRRIQSLFQAAQFVRQLDKWQRSVYGSTSQPQTRAEHSMLRIVAVIVKDVLPGWQRSKTIVVEPPMSADIVENGILLMDAGRRTDGAPHLLVPWGNITCVEVSVEQPESQ